jgi:hypothetical protein
MSACSPEKGITTRLIDVKQQGDAVTFAVRVQPRASRDAIGGEWPAAPGQRAALKVRLTAPPRRCKPWANRRGGFATRPRPAPTR